MNEPRRLPATLVAGLLLGGAVLLVFGRSLGADLVWDDKNLISMNLWLARTDTVWRTWSHDFWFLTNSGSESGMYRPLVIDSYWLEHRLWGNSPVGYHAVSLLLHVGNSLLVFTLARRLQIGSGAALAGALFFAIHPVQVEAVASVASRTDLLATLGVLSACLLWTGSERSRKVALAPLFLALCAKESAVVGPLLLLLVDRRMGRPLLSKSSIWVALPWLPWLLLRGRALGFASGGAGDLQDWQGGARVFAYLGRVVVPLPQGPITELGSVPPSVALASALVLAGLGIALLRLRPGHPAAFAGLWVLLAFLPVSEVVPLGARYADLLLYLAMCGLAIGLAEATDSVLGRTAPRSRPGGLLGAGGLATLLVLGFVSSQWTGVWANDLSLWSHGVHHNPGSVVANLNLGNALRSGGHHEEGCAQLAVAGGLVDAEADPVTASRILYNLGNCAREEQRWDLAEERYRASSRLSGGQFLPARFNLVTTLGAAGRADAGLAESRTLIVDAPELAPSWHLHGVMLAKLGQYPEAIEAFDRALAIDPSSADSGAFRDRAREILDATPTPP